LNQAKELCDELDYNVCENIDSEFHLLDSRRDNAVRQCIDRALYLLDMASYEIMGRS
jgi:hypothetical protein